MKKMTSGNDERYVEVVEQNGVRTEIWRNRDGEVVEIVKYAKWVEDDPRGKGPMGNEQKRPS